MKIKRLTAALLAAAMTLGTFSAAGAADIGEDMSDTDVSVQTGNVCSGLDEQTLEILAADAESGSASDASADSGDSSAAALTEEERSGIKEAIYDDIFFSQSGAVDVSGYSVDVDTMCALTDEVLKETGTAELVTYAYEEDEVSGNATVAVYSVSSELAAAASEVSEIALTTESGTSSVLTDEQVETILNLYAQYLTHYNENVAYLGRQTPWYTSKESDDGDDGLGPLGSMLALAGYTVDDVRSGNYSYDQLIGTIQTFYYSNYFGVLYYGEDILTAKDEALETVAASGAQTDAQKLLILNEWLADHASFDTVYIMDMSGDAVLEASDAQQSEHYQDMYQYFCELYASYGDYASSAAAQLTAAVENMWSASSVGALALHEGVCTAYTNAYTYLVQWMYPEVYAADGETLTTDADSWKTVQELNYVATTSAEDVATTVQSTDDAGNALYYALDEDGSRIASSGDGSDGGYATTTEVTAEPVTEETTETVDTTTYTLSTDAAYIVDCVMFNYVANFTLFGKTEKSFAAQHFWNAVKIDGEWYYIDPCFIDVYTEGTFQDNMYVECMLRERVETNGVMNHMFFLISDASTRALYSDYSSAEILTLYEGVATDTSYENNAWMYYAASNIYGDGDGNFYYAYDSQDLLTAIGDSYSSYSDDTEHKIVCREASGNDKDTSYTTLIDFNSGTVRDPQTGEMQENELIAQLYALHQQYEEIYPELTLTMALYDGVIYFNVANCVLSYDLETGEVVRVKEYNEVGAVRDDTQEFGGTAFDVVYDLSEADVTVSNPPIAGLTIADGNLYIDVATNYTYMSGRDADNYTDSSSYGWEYQESNYNADYDSDVAKTGSSDEENDNMEFQWCANFTDTIGMSELTGSAHSYETVSVAASCGQNAFTESRCADCGLIEDGTRVEEDGTACAHHYVQFDETYYTKSGSSWNTGTCYVCVICGDCVNSGDSDWDSAAASAAEGHSYVVTEDGITWAEDYSSAEVTKVTCSVCGDLVSHVIRDGAEVTVPNWDCLQEDDTITVGLEQPLACDVTSEVTKDATCTEAGVRTYTAAVIFDGQEYTFTETDAIAALGHSYGEPAFTWGDDNTCTAAFTCAVCGDIQTAACSVTSETTDATCTQAGATVYTATVTLDGTTYTDTKTVEIAALGHSYGEPAFTWGDDNTCTAAFTCAACGDAQTVTCSVTSETTDATCTEAGATVYTATATLDGATYTDTKTVEIAALGHSYGEPVFIWGDDDTCTAVFTCAACGDTQTVSCEVVENDDGSHTATCTFDGATYTKTKSATPVEEIFTDVSATSWYHDAVQFVYDNDLMSGTSDTTFSPTTETTRAMVVQVLYNMHGKPEVSGEMPFSDVEAGTWYYDAVLWAYQNGVTAGDGKGNFNPTANVTREQFAQFLYNDAGTPEVTGSIAFTDADSVSGWATNAILWATQNGIMNGKQSGSTVRLDPKGEATRAEVAAMLKNYLA